MEITLFFYFISMVFGEVWGMFDPDGMERNEFGDMEGSKDVISSPVPYNFRYNHEDKFGNVQHREENRNEDGVVRGSYGYRDPDGMYRHVSYIADAGGFHAVLRTNEPGIENRNSADVAVVAQLPSSAYKLMRRYSKFK